MASHERRLDEETPLLQKKSNLPWRQLSLVFLSWLADPVSSTYILPFINQLIRELDVTEGDDRKIGYYAGLVESLYYATQALTTWRWCQISDHMGRRPIVLIALFSLSASNFAFGLSRTLATLIISRCIAGLLSGNVGVMNSMVGDITDHSNMADAFGFALSFFCLGATIAPLIGGALAKPQERWPDIFCGEFWSTYPYFLPSFVSACFTLVIFFICAAFLKETLPSKTGMRTHVEGPTTDDDSANMLANDDRPIPISSLLTTASVMIPISNYGTLALMEIGFLVLLPLFYSSPIDIGGLGLPPSIIGTYLATFGIADGLSQALLVPAIIKWVGPKRLFCWSILSFYPMILIFPIMSAIVTVQGKVGPVIWMLMILQLISMVVMDMSYTVIYMFVTRAAPNKRSLGATNGIGQCLTSIARAIGPALTNSLFAASKEYNILGGNFVYLILVTLTTFLVFLSRNLPKLKYE